MPHHAAVLVLRPRANKVVKTVAPKNTILASDMRSWTPIKLLKYGLEKKLYKKKGWLVHLLRREGILDDSKQSKKARCWSDYKAQTHYIDAMKEVLHDETLDPTSNPKKTGSLHQVEKANLFPRRILSRLFTYAMHTMCPTLPLKGGRLKHL
jgi:hypothetical protein